MSDDRFRMRIVFAADRSRPFREILADADAVMRNEGFRRIHFTPWDDSGGAWNVAGIYERRPPTLRETGDAMAEFIDNLPMYGDEAAEAIQLVTTWREAVEDQDAT